MDLVEPEDEAPRWAPRRRLAAGGLGVLLSIGLVAVLVAARLGSNDATMTPPSAPPAWLVEAANRLASSTGDPHPTSARWVLSDASTIAPAVGLATGDPTVSRYLIVLEGRFTANAPRPPGAEAPSGSIATAAYDPATHAVTDWGLSDRIIALPGLQSFSLGG